ncbi:MAG: DUF1697 domain-containing protein [Chloroflexi bacterium]|nr:DUF1697 domain-containing protein [Chloroflexota bacterium]
MPKHIAFLRAINVGGHTIKMNELRRLFESLGLANVETFIASGNVIFEAKAGNTKALEKRIESHLKESLGYEVATFIRTEVEVGEIAKYKPFSQAKLNSATALNVCFLSDTPDKTMVEKLMAMKTDIDDFHVYRRELYWLCQKKQSESKISNAALEKALGIKTTLRGMNTINRLSEKFKPA